MHLYSERVSCSDENSTKMSNAALDVRLRRQMPVTAKPPRLRLGIRSSLQSKCLQQDISANHAPSIPADRFSMSCLESKSCHNQTVANNEIRKKVTNGIRPIIHHQRHNLKNRFLLIKTLGEGTYGKVKLASDKATGEHVAIKYIKKTKIEDENDLVRIRREIQILSSLRHKHIVNIREVFEKKDKIVLVLDYAQGGELYDYLNKMGRLSESEARRIFRQIVSAIHYCHQNGIVHRDLKLENIILDDEGNVKIADFGLSNYYSHSSTLSTFCGSPLYASPEIVNGKPYHGPEVDVWSLGVILYTLVYGAMPFESNSLVSLKQQISDGDFKQPSTLSDAAGLIRHMLTVTPSRRATMDDALRHWWINFGHSMMPNDMPYSPDDEPPSIPHSVKAEKLPPIATLNPVIIHHRSQSSISSDSDVELDFKPNRWSKRTISLDSTGNSVSSSVAGSPAPTSDNCKSCLRESDDDSAAIASGLLKLPPDVLEILKGCSSKSLAALLNTDLISSDFGANVSSRGSRTSHTGQKSTEESAVSEKMSLSSSSVFDSERKPKRGILKRKGKFSGNDSGCVMPEEMAMRSEENALPRCGHLPHRLPSFRGEAHGIFASKRQSSQLLDHVSTNLHIESCSSAIVHSSASSQVFMQQPHHHQHSHLKQTSEDIQDSLCLPTPDVHCHSDSVQELTTTNFTNENASLEQETSAQTSSEDSISANNFSKDPVKVIYRPKSILKKSSMDDGKNRLSVSSIGSNSSADILDLSYDSGDSDHYVNCGTDHSPSTEENDAKNNGAVAKEHLIDQLRTADQRSYSLDEGMLVLQISDQSPGLAYAARNRSLSDENGQLLVSSSSLMCRLAMDSQSLQ
ncbi:hypothetical protein BsWGS_11399 [Bradybaena similaris]